MVIYVKKSNSILKINLSIFMFVAYAIFIIINDYFCFFIKNIPNKISYLLSFIVIIFLYCIIRKKIKIIIDKFNKIDILFFVFLLFILGLRVAIPDSSYDTLNYHLYLQENPFANNISYNFFPARWINTFSLPLKILFAKSIHHLSAYR